jgi:hypothetical protein
VKKRKPFFNPAPESFANKFGHPVVHGAQVFVIYWDPNDLYHGDWQGIIDTFMHNVKRRDRRYRPRLRRRHAVHRHDQQARQRRFHVSRLLHRRREISRVGV